MMPGGRWNRIGPCLVLPLALLLAAAALSAPQVYLSGPDSLLALDSLRVAGELKLPAARDMALSPSGQLMVLGRKGELHRLSVNDSLQVVAFDGDLLSGAWPQALAADGPDWILLIDQSRVLQRLGPRGEALDRLLLPVQEIFWRGLAVDRSGRIWLAEEAGGAFLIVNRSGELLQRWDLEQRLPGFEGPVQAWCVDNRGGIFLAEGWPTRLHHLNAAGNRLASWDAPQGARALALAAPPRVWKRDGVLMVTSVREGGIGIASWGAAHLIVMESDGRLWLLESEGP